MLKVVLLGLVTFRVGISIMRDFYVGFYSVAILEFPPLFSLVCFNNRVNLVFKYP